MQSVPQSLTPTGLSLTAAASVAFAELAGYLLHRLLHSGQCGSLSRSHLIHHMVHYGPYQPMRAPIYRNATDGRVALGNVGMEWILPIALILLAIWGAMNVVGIAWIYQLIALVTMTSWAVLMFSYLHDRMHVQDFWMEGTPLLKTWFLRARRLHDIHHHTLNDEGQMDHNFGIAFFWVDRLFGTFADRHSPLNRHGYRAALRRYRREALSEEETPAIPSGFRV